MVIKYIVPNTAVISDVACSTFTVKLFGLRLTTSKITIKSLLQRQYDVLLHNI